MTSLVFGFCAGFCTCFIYYGFIEVAELMQQQDEVDQKMRTLEWQLKFQQEAQVAWFRFIDLRLTVLESAAEAALCEDQALKAALGDALLAESFRVTI